MNLTNNKTNVDFSMIGFKQIAVATPESQVSL